MTERHEDEPGSWFQPRVSSSAPRQEPPGVVPVTAASAEPADPLIVVGWACTFLLPIVGLILGVILTTRRSEHGVPMMIVSVVWAVLAAIFLSFVFNG